MKVGGIERPVCEPVQKSLRVDPRALDFVVLYVPIHLVQFHTSLTDDSLYAPSAACSPESPLSPSAASGPYEFGSV